VKRGEDPPLPTAPERDREAVVAHQAEMAAKQIARKAEAPPDDTRRRVEAEAARTSTSP